jgi:hypothetical protein
MTSNPSKCASTNADYDSIGCTVIKALTSRLARSFAQIASWEAKEDPGGGLPRPSRRGGGDDTEEAGGERASGARGRAVASDVLLGGIAHGQEIRGREGGREGCLCHVAEGQPVSEERGSGLRAKGGGDG